MANLFDALSLPAAGSVPSPYGLAAKGGLQYFLGAAFGMSVDRSFPPPFYDGTGDNSIQADKSLAREAALLIAQAGALASAGAIAISSASRLDLFSADPTNGMCFVLGVLHTQRNMAARALKVGALIGDQVALYGPQAIKMLPKDTSVRGLADTLYGNVMHMTQEPTDEATYVAPMTNTYAEPNPFVQQSLAY